MGIRESGESEGKVRIYIYSSRLHSPYTKETPKKVRTKMGIERAGVTSSTHCFMTHFSLGT